MTVHRQLVLQSHILAMPLRPHHPSSSDGKSTMMTVLSFGIASLLLLLSLASPATSCSEQEMGSLLRFLSGLSQDKGLATAWRNHTDCCKWEGITCSADGMVIEVSLASRGLEGSISPSLADLTNLLHLNLSYNSFSGGLPSELLASNIIAVLDVSFNQLSRVLFTGELPSVVWENNSNLVVLNASNNSFQGWIPSSFCISSLSFAELDLSYNQFSGTIPPGLGNCSALEILKAGHNQLSGTLPDELFNVSSLQHLSFPNNFLYGTLDSVMKLRNLAILDLGDNMLNGEIPDSIGKLKRLEELHLDNNDMFGGLPPALSNCTNVITIDLKRNTFSGELTKVNFSTLINLNKLDLLLNNFTGTIPENLYSCSNLNALRLSDNKLHGQVSPKISNLKSLVFLSASFNKFTNITNALHVLKDCKELAVLMIGSNFKGEAMPEDETIDGFQNLQLLSLSGCSLSGKIPLWLSQLKKLRILFLESNQLTGTIPAWFKSLKSLYFLDISKNKLTGEIPADLMEMPMLTTENTTTYLDQRVFVLPIYRGTSFEYRETTAFPKLLNLDYNNFTGVIPKEIGQLKSLAVLNFSSNSLSGEIPLQLQGLMNLQVLDLSNNYLTGAIPMELNNLHFLAVFNVSNNNLEGPIPTGGQFTTFTNSSFAGNPKLCGAIVHRHCGLAEAPSVSVHSTEQTDTRVAFAIAFGVFFGVGLLYDQIVLSRYFG